MRPSDNVSSHFTLRKKWVLILTIGVENYARYQTVGETEIEREDIWKKSTYMFESKCIDFP